jgi:hypothetical protein
MVIFNFIIIIFRIFVIVKVGFLLTMTSQYPETYPLSLLNWWIYYLIFDIWLLTTFKLDNHKEQ